MPSTKYMGLSYPTHFLKSRDSVIRNNFQHFLRDEMLFIHYSIQIKQIIVYRHISCYCNDTIYS